MKVIAVSGSFNEHVSLYIKLFCITAWDRKNREMPERRINHSMRS